jgi:hypothetical protein
VFVHLRRAIVLLLAAAIVGVWLVLAPFLLDYQPVGARWVTATRQQLATGAALTAASVATVLTMVGTALRGAGATPHDESEHPPSSAG